VRDKYYTDKRDLIKWGVLLHLAEEYSLQRIIQIAYLRKTEWGRLEIDGKECELPGAVIHHFRNVRNVAGLTDDPVIQVIDSPFSDHDAYLQEILSAVRASHGGSRLIFLDPDTGLEPSRPNLNHVLSSEIKSIWDALRRDDVLVCYQHQTNRNGQPWIDSKRAQFAEALAVDFEAVKVASGNRIAPDVVFFFYLKKLQ
jgi:hypothetical protein